MKTLTPKEFNALKEKESSLQLVDVREVSEFESEHVEGAENKPLSRFDKSMASLDKQKPVYLLCSTGSRAAQASKKLKKHGYEDVCVIEGGLEALKGQGCKTKQGQTRVWAMDRQVRMAAGVFILASILGTWWVHPTFILVAVFVACGLIFSAVTNTCGMALLLGKCPWNQSRK